MKSELFGSTFKPNICISNLCFGILVESSIPLINLSGVFNVLR